ncbi:replication fork protection component Swi3-domain-containing protein [Pelagophyceae sp. CCMP2097]|nr:replication fork protection component Swi3-domain-containing protein [Pelagophyceae sp. CCMP2097]
MTATPLFSTEDVEEAPSRLDASDDEEGASSVLPKGSALPSALKDGATVKARVPRPKFTENHLMKDTGLDWLREHMPKVVRPRGAGHEAADAARLIEHYEGWAERMFPKLPFNEMLGRIEKLGSKALVRNFVESLRQEHRWVGKKRMADDEPDNELKKSRADDDDDDDANNVALFPAAPRRDEAAEETWGDDEDDEDAVLAQAEADDRKQQIAAKRLAALELLRQKRLAKLGGEPSDTGDS